MNKFYAYFIIKFVTVIVISSSPTMLLMCKGFA